MVFTKKIIENQIESIEKNIAKKKNELEKLNDDLMRINAKLHDLEEYEKKPIEERTLSRYIYEDTGSVALMDEFESLTEEGFKKYERLRVKNIKNISGIRCQLIIERMKENNDYHGDITMTDFKKGYTSSLMKYVTEEINNYKKSNKIESKQFIAFSSPYLLRAQNSSNRTGYGSEYNGYDLVYQGTLYGETTKYAFVGIIVE